MNHYSFPGDPLTQRIESLMLSLHVPAHLMGFRYLERAIYLVCGDPTLLFNVVGRLYTIAAAEMGTTLSCFERDMRTALKKVPDLDYSSVFGYHCDPTTRRITPKEFIALCAGKLRYDTVNQKKEQ
ncbi:MAG: hypothetical protein E7632_08040 [Ruminococcaceae bacterium]|nr:hypothetical protein [Oscillospiraceae bacterium]